MSVAAAGEDRQVTLADAVREHSIAKRLWMAASRSAQFRAGLVMLVVLVALAVVWPLISPVSGTKMAIADRTLPPAFLGGHHWDHILGTDQLGRDLLVRSLIGLQNALMIAITTVVLMFAIGSAVGIISGFFGGWTDVVLMRLTDAQLSVPLIVLAITILTVSRPTPEAIVLVLALSGWPVYARVTRSVTLAERRKEYVRGAQILGASPVRIMLLILAPNILPPIAFVAVLDVARMMIYEAILGFLGIGVQPPTPTFGNIIADGRKYLINAWWIASVPGMFLFLALLSINLMGASLERARNRLYKGVI
jgi:peptide/nickel transport system permease protein